MPQALEWGQGSHHLATLSWDTRGVSESPAPQQSAVCAWVPRLASVNHNQETIGGKVQITVQPEKEFKLESKGDNPIALALAQVWEVTWGGLKCGGSCTGDVQTVCCIPERTPAATGFSMGRGLPVSTKDDPARFPPL